MTRLLVSHPHAAVFANAAAAGLAQAGLLARYTTGVAAAAQSPLGHLLARLSSRYPTAANRVVAGVSALEMQALAPVELAARLAARVPGNSITAYDAMFLAQDFANSVLPWPDALNGVYAFEDAAEWTFARAQKAGLLRVYDLPIPHYGTLETMWRQQAAAWPDAVPGPPPVEPGWKKTRKDRELASADIAVVASAFTEQSLERAGYQGAVLRNAYGFPGAPFVPRRGAPTGPFTVLAVGTQDLRKGTPYLLQAWKHAGLKDARLRVIGRFNLAPSFLAGFAGEFEHIPALARAMLPVEYQRADVLVFPTLGDGFGMVISEAMACGTPVITTACGGGPEVITPGVDGVLIPAGNTDALVDALRWAAANRNALHAMGQAAAVRAQRYTWTDAGRGLARKVVESLSGLARGTASPNAPSGR